MQAVGPASGRTEKGKGTKNHELRVASCGRGVSGVRCQVSKLTIDTGLRIPNTFLRNSLLIGRFIGTTGPTPAGNGERRRLRVLPGEPTTVGRGSGGMPSTGCDDYRPGRCTPPARPFFRLPAAGDGSVANNQRTGEQKEKEEEKECDRNGHEGGEVHGCLLCLNVECRVRNAE